MSNCNVYDVGDRAIVKVTFTNPADGLPTDPTTVKLKYTDPSGVETVRTYGDGTIIKDDIGIYRAAIREASASPNNLDLSGYWTYVWIGEGGDASGVEQETFYVRPVDVDAPASGYSTRQDLYNIYGNHNVNKWADLNNDGVEADIASRINWSISRADAEINSRLNGGPWTLPFVAPIDPIIIDLSARYAGVLLYESRGITDANTPGNHELLNHKNMVEKEIRELLAGQRGLSTVAKNYTHWPENILSD